MDSEKPKSKYTTINILPGTKVRLKDLWKSRDKERTCKNFDDLINALITYIESD